MGVASGVARVEGPGRGREVGGIGEPRDRGPTLRVEGEGGNQVAVRSAQERRIDESRSRRRESRDEGVAPLDASVVARIEDPGCRREVQALCRSGYCGRALRVESEGRGDVDRATP